MKHEAYSDLKAAYHLQDIADMREGKQIVPRQVQLILSDLCNQDCVFCSYRMSNGLSSEQFPDAEGNRNPKRMIPTEKAQEILFDCANLGVKAIQFTGGGEPTVHPDHMNLFETCLDLSMEAALVTNGVLLRPGWEAILPNFAWIRVSIDAASAEQYAAIRRVPASMYGKALANLARLAGEIARVGSPCLLGAGYVITRDNYQSLSEGVAHIKETGASYVRLSAMFSTDGEKVYDDIDDAVRDEVARASELESPSFKVVDLYRDRISDLRQHAPDYDFCGYQQFNCYIGGNLKVYRCCNTAYTLHGEVGDLRNQRFKDWFHSEQKKRAYGEFCARSCDFCQFSKVNRNINYLVGDPPLHSNFV